MKSMKQIVGHDNIAMIVLDTLRLDVARSAMDEGMTPNLSRLLPNGWEHRHTSATFTFPAHQAFFAGFLPTKVTPGPHPRHFAIKFAGSETIDDGTCVFDTPNIVAGLANSGYHTMCIGGVGFFNLETPMGRILPSYFKERHWHKDLGVTCKESTRHQVELIAKQLAANSGKKVFLYLNISALHQPNCMYVPGEKQDSVFTQKAALAYVDQQIPPLLEAMRQHGPWFVMIFSDHGTCYGEDGYTGHRVAHSVVLNVPYGEFVL